MSHGKTFTVTTHCSASPDNVLGMVSKPIVSNLLFLAAVVDIVPMKKHYSNCNSSVRWIFWPVFSVSLKCICAITFPAILPSGISFLPERIKLFIPFILITRPALQLLVGCDRRSSSMAQHILKPQREKLTCNVIAFSLPPYKTLLLC